jgi:FHA domain-containing protein
MLTIQVMSIKGDAPPAPMVGVFMEPVGTIGRYDGNTLVLPDPERRISRTHARVVAAGDSYVIENHGAGLPVLINDRPLAPGAQAVLAHADLLQIGQYVMRVAMASGGGESRTLIEAADDTTRQMQAPGTAARAVSDDPLALFGATAPAAADDPFANLLAPPPPSALVPPTSSDSARAPTIGGGLIPDDFDPFAPPAPPPVSPAQRATGGPLADFDLGVGPGVPGQSLDELFGLGGKSVSDPFGPLSGSARSASDPFPPGHPLAAPISQANTAGSADPLAALQAGESTGGKPVHVQRDDAPQVNAAFVLPTGVPGAGSIAAPAADPFLSWEHGTHTGEVEPIRQFEVVPPPAAPAVVLPRPARAPAPAPAAPATGDEAAAMEKLLQSLLDGAGVGDLPRMPALTPELMRVFGELLRIATEGTLQLLVARALTKREVHAEATMIAARENNPLKFSPTVEVALQHLLAPAGRGFMSPPRALKDAYDDLRSHQFGVMAGTQAALAGVLARFNPAQLEQRLTQKSMLDSVVPMHRKAKLWDLFTDLYSDISKEAEEDFNTLFGKAFVKAYEAQIEKLRQEQQAQPHPHAPRS